jgi:hypothetical protein
LLAAVTAKPERELQDALTQLTSGELVFVHGQPPEATYTFKHALVQDAAYSTLLRGKRQQLHARIVEVLESCFPNTVETEPALLGRVFKPTQTALLGQDQGCECVKGGPKWPAWLAPRAMAGRLLGTQSGFENRP